MLLLRVIVTLIACWIVKCDLLDLYVQHMDETMRTKLYNNKRHSMYPVSRRIKRSPETEEPFRIDNFKKQRLDVDQINVIYYQNDALNHPNKREENHDPDQYEMLLSTTQDSKHPEETTMISEAENSQVLIEKKIETVKSTSNIVKDEIESNISHYATIEEQKEELKDTLPIVLQNQTDDEKFVIKPLELAEDISVKEWKNSEEMEDEENSQFEIINEDERIDLKPFDDPSFKRMPKLWGNRIPKKYFPLEKLGKTHIKDKMKMRFRRSAKESGVNRKIFNDRVPKFTRYEKLDEDGDVILEWDPSDDEEVIFRVTAKTLGYVGIGFNEKSHMMGADILLAWIDDHTGVVNLLVSWSPIRNLNSR